MKRVEMNCNHCGAKADGSWNAAARKIENPDGWRYLSREIDLCGDCSREFQAWLSGIHRSRCPNENSDPGSRWTMITVVVNVDRDDPIVESVGDFAIRFAHSRDVDAHITSRSADTHEALYK